MKLGELRKFVEKYYTERLFGKSVVNQDKGIRVFFGGLGRSKMAQGGAVYFKKMVTVKILKEIVKYAEYSNFGERKNSDPKEAVGYFNFKAKVFIDGQLEHVRVAIRIDTKGRFIYEFPYKNIEVNKKK